MLFRVFRNLSLAMGFVLGGFVVRAQDFSHEVPLSTYPAEVEQAPAAAVFPFKLGPIKIDQVQSLQVIPSLSEPDTLPKLGNGTRFVFNLGFSEHDTGRAGDSLIVQNGEFHFVDAQALNLKFNPPKDRELTPEEVERVKAVSVTPFKPYCRFLLRFSKSAMVAQSRPTTTGLTVPEGYAVAVDRASPDHPCLRKNGSVDQDHCIELGSGIFTRLTCYAGQGEHSDGHGVGSALTLDQIKAVFANRDPNALPLVSIE